MRVAELIASMSDEQKANWERINEYPFDEEALLLSPLDVVIPSLLEAMLPTEDDRITQLMDMVGALQEKVGASPAQIIVNIPEQRPPVVHVAAPVINVPPPVVNIQPAEITVEAPIVNIPEQKAPVVHMPRTPVTVKLKQPETIVETTTFVYRDPETGQILKTRQTTKDKQ